jgi:hypothetical protein
MGEILYEAGGVRNLKVQAVAPLTPFSPQAGRRE